MPASSRRLFWPLVLLALITGYLIYSISTYHRSDEVKNERVTLTNTIRWKQVPLEKLADLLTTCPDTAYHAKYFARGRKFETYRLRSDGSIWDDPAIRTSPCLQDALDMAKQIEVSSILNNPADSFYRIEFPGGAYLIPEVYIPKHQTSVNLLSQKLTSMYKVSERVYLKFPHR